jgi:hypothetical protein
MNPAAVRRDAARADEMIMALAKSKELKLEDAKAASVPVDTSVPETPEDSPVEAQETQDQISGQAAEQLELDSGTPYQDQDQDQGVEHHAANDQSEATENSVNLDILVKSVAQWEQRYKTLQGMFNQQAKQVEQYQELLSRMSEAQTSQAPAASAPKKPVESLVTKEDIDSFGDDLIDVSRRVAREEYAQAVAQMSEKIAQLESQLSGVAQTSAQTQYERFVNRLRQEVPKQTGHDFDKINNDPAFEQWIIDSPTRKVVFDTAMRSYDHAAMLDMFSMYGARLQAPASSQLASKPPAQVDPRLLKQVAPGKSKSTPSPAQPATGEKQQWTRSAIAQFYSERNKMPKSDADKIERNIAAAMKSGRVDYSQ